MRPEVKVWLHRGSHQAEGLSAMQLLALKRAAKLRVSVVVPARNEEATIGAIVSAIRSELVEDVPLVDEVVVIDSRSTDATAEVASGAGAVVAAAEHVLVERGSYPGKGEALWKSLALTTGDVVVFVDGDVRSFSTRYVTGLLSPLLSDPGIALVKAMYERPLSSGGIDSVGGGRVTELVARPLLNMHWPLLAGFVQPLSGEYAGRRSVLERVPFLTGYGVELALLIDVLELVGLEAMAQVDLGRRVHRHQSDAALGRMASALWQTALERLQRQGDLVLRQPPNRHLVQFRRAGPGFEADTVEVSDTERPPMTLLRRSRSARVTRPSAAIVSFRLGGSDGVSVESAKWGTAFKDIGLDVTTVAGSGKVDHIVAGLELDAAGPVDRTALEAGLADVDLVIVENVCSLPRNVDAARALADELAGRPTILHHHDLPWQRQGMRVPQAWPPTDPAWCHVTINSLTQMELLGRGVAATHIPNTFDRPPLPGRRMLTRARLGVPDEAWLVLQPTRALPRKGVPDGIALAEALGAVFWLTGPAEDGYESGLAEELAGAGCPVRRGLPDGLSMVDAYAACDVVAFPSTWEGFGNPVIESAVQRRPLAVADYPVLHELAGYGLEWFSVSEPDDLRRFLHRPDEALLDRNAAIAEQHFSSRVLTTRLRSLLLTAGWPHLLLSPTEF